MLQSGYSRSRISAGLKRFIFKEKLRANWISANWRQSFRTPIDMKHCGDRLGVIGKQHRTVSGIANQWGNPLFLYTEKSPRTNIQINNTAIVAISHSFNQQYPSYWVKFWLFCPSKKKSNIFSLIFSFFSNGGKTFQVQLLQSQLQTTEHIGGTSRALP